MIQIMEALRKIKEVWLKNEKKNKLKTHEVKSNYINQN